MSHFATNNPIFSKLSSSKREFARVHRWLFAFSAEIAKVDNVPKCTICKDVVKPDIVFFGENLPRRWVFNGDTHVHSTSIAYTDDCSTYNCLKNYSAHLTLLRRQHFKGVKKCEEYSVVAHLIPKLFSLSTLCLQFLWVSRWRLCEVWSASDHRNFTSSSTVRRLGRQVRGGRFDQSSLTSVPDNPVRKKCILKCGISHISECTLLFLDFW